MLMLVLVLALAASDGPHRSATREPQLGASHSWTARSSTGRTLGGSWTFQVDAKTGHVTGTWTVNDAAGRAVARGGWSAAKSRKGWTGAWRAAVAGSDTEYAGTWEADTDLRATASWADLFKAAVKAAVGGRWRAGGQSGTWSIRVFE